MDRFRTWTWSAERLMAELGRLDDPGDRMGMRDAQRLRAVGVVIDIGGLPLAVLRTALAAP